MKKQLHQTPLGQSMSEYGLAIALIAIVCIGGLTFLSGQLTRTLSSVVTGLFGSPTLAVAGNPQGGGGGTQTGTGGTLTLQNGTTISLNPMPNDMGSTIETTGANGATKQLMAQMDRLIQAAKDSGDLDPAQAAILQRLSNQGHLMAEAQQLLEQHLLKADVNSDFENYMRANRVNFNGETMTLDALYHGMDYMGGILPDASRPETLLDPNLNKPGALVKEFATLYQEAVSSGALDDPAMKGAIQDLSLRITTLGTAMAAGLQFFQNDPAMTQQQREAAVLRDIASQYETFAGPDGALAGSVSQTTHSNSGGICNTGGGTDTGTQCNN